MENIPGFAYDFKYRLRMYEGHTIVHDTINCKAYPKEAWGEIMAYITEHMAVDGFATPTFFVPRSVLAVLDLERKPSLDLGNDAGLLTVESVDFQGKVPVLPHMRDDADWLELLTMRRYFKDRQISQERGSIHA